MKALLDTHCFVWSLYKKKSISQAALEVLENTENEIYLSTISLWEISLKHSIGKLKIKGLKPKELPSLAKKLDFSILELGAEESASFHELKKLHGDPFDRMLIWQAIQKKLTLISADQDFKKYQKLGLKLIW